MSTCLLCEIRKPRRYCPGVRGEICTLCCGTEREVTVDCPYECEYLREARLHEKLVPVDPENLPNKDIHVSEEFLRDHGQLLHATSEALLMAAVETPGATDGDIREALAAFIRTYRTLDSGLIYESRPNNPYAAAIQQRLQAHMQDYRQRAQQSAGIHTVRDSEVLGVVVFLERMALHHNNGRRRCRAFFDFLQENFSPPPAEGPLLVGG